ncbi:MAG: MBL fold metallo-hydrolase [Gammaproteobacteria bacterium]|nr:MBL fold metallo-hydrolase [Gammaproteobacteria bacterium]
MIKHSRIAFGFIYFLLVLISGVVNAQGGLNFEAIEIETVQLEDNVHILMGGPAQGNVLVLSGPDGVFMVDSMYAPMHDKLVSAIGEISAEPIRYVVNTHMHGDHTAGNDALKAVGAQVIGQENIRARMAALGPGNLPDLQYQDSITLHMNGEEILISWPQPAHTDHDSMIFLKNANILHVGDIPSNLRYPNIGIDDGGSVDGMTQAARMVLDLIDEDTRLIAGHLGPIVPVIEMEAQLAMFAEVSERIQAMIDRGMSLEEVLAARPTADFDEARSAGAITPERFTGLVYTDLSRRQE